MSKKNKDNVAEKIRTDNKKNGKYFFAKNRIIIGIVMLVAAIFLSVVILPKAVQNSGAKNLYKFKASLKAGTAITMDMVEKTSTSDPVILGLYIRIEDINSGKFVTRTDVTAGEYVTKLNAVSSTDGGADIVPAGKQLMSIPVDSIQSSVSYKIKAGDIIRFYALLKKTDGTKEIYVQVPALLQYVKIHEVYDADGIASSVSGGVPKSVTLIVDDNQALEIVKLVNTEKVYYSLMASGSAKNAESMIEKQETVLKQVAAGVNVDNIVIDPAELDTGNLEFSGEVPNPEYNDDLLSEDVTDTTVEDTETTEDNSDEQTD